MRMPRMRGLSYLLWLGAGFIGISEVLGVGRLELAIVVILAAFFRHGVESGRRVNPGWIPRLPHWLERPMPLAIATIAAIWMASERMHGHPSGGAMNLLVLSMAAAAWSLGRRAASEGFGWLDYREDIAFGATGTLVVGALATSSLRLSLSAGMTAALVAVVWVACLMIALQEEPWYVTRDALIKQAFARYRAQQLTG